MDTLEWLETGSGALHLYSDVVYNTTSSSSNISSSSSKFKRGVP